MTRRMVPAKRQLKSEDPKRGDPRIEVAVVIIRKMLGSFREVQPKAS